MGGCKLKKVIKKAIEFGHKSLLETKTHYSCANSQVTGLKMKKIEMRKSKVSPVTTAKPLIIHGLCSPCAIE